MQKAANEENISDLGLTTKQVARKLHLAPCTLERMRKHGGGPPFIEVNGRVFYPCHEYYQWIQGVMGTMTVSAL